MIYSSAYRGAARSAALFFLVSLTMLQVSCKTLSEVGVTRNYNGSAPSAYAGSSQNAPDIQCSRAGGAFIDNKCVCSDGTFVENTTNKNCANWVKEKYSSCFSRGGQAKTWNGKTECFCPHGEIINANGNQSCYQLFTQRNSGCANQKGIVLAADSTCKCLHGPATFSIGNTSCEEDFKKKHPHCFAKRGVIRTGDICECRDGTFVDNQVNGRCYEPWFFYTDQSIIAPKPQGNNQNQNPQTQPPQNSDFDPKANCVCQHYKDNCIVYKPGDANSLAFKPTKPSECTRLYCYNNFSDVLRAPLLTEPNKGGCGGYWTFKSTPLPPEEKPPMQDDTPQNLDQYCVCKAMKTTTPIGCALYKPGRTDPISYAPSASRCDQQACINYFGDSYALKQQCTVDGKILWRPESTN